MDSSDGTKRWDRFLLMTMEPEQLKQVISKEVDFKGRNVLHLCCSGNDRELYERVQDKLPDEAYFQTDRDNLMPVMHMSAEEKNVPALERYRAILDKTNGTVADAVRYRMGEINPVFCLLQNGECSWSGDDEDSARLGLQVFKTMVKTTNKTQLLQQFPQFESRTLLHFLAEEKRVAELAWLCGIPSGSEEDLFETPLTTADLANTVDADGSSAFHLFFYNLEEFFLVLTTEEERALKAKKKARNFEDASEEELLQKASNFIETELSAKFATLRCGLELFAKLQVDFNHTNKYGDTPMHFLLASNFLDNIYEMHHASKKILGHPSKEFDAVVTEAIFVRFFYEIVFFSRVTSENLPTFDLTLANNSKETPLHTFARESCPLVKHMARQALFALFQIDGDQARLEKSNKDPGTAKTFNFPLLQQQVASLKDKTFQSSFAELMRTVVDCNEMTILECILEEDPDDDDLFSDYDDDEDFMDLDGGSSMELEGIAEGDLSDDAIEPEEVE